MDSLKRTTNRITSNKVFWASFAVSLLGLSGIFVYCGNNYSIDSYGLTLDKHINSFLGAYRYFGAMIFKLFSPFGHSPIKDCTSDVVFAWILFALASAVLCYTVIKKLNVKSGFGMLALELSVLITFSNAWIFEVMSFPECVFVTSLGALLCSLAVYLFVSKKHIVSTAAAAVLLICATAVYQQFFSIFAIYIIALLSYDIICRGSGRLKFRDIVRVYSKPFLFLLISGIMYVAVGKAVIIIFDVPKNPRLAFGVYEIIDSVLYFVKKQHSFLAGRGYFDGEIMTVMYLVMFFIFGILWLYDLIKKKRIINSFSVLFSFVVAYGSAYIPCIGKSHGARGLFALFSIFALLTIGSLILSKRKFVTVLICLVLTITFGANVKTYISAEINQKKANALDEIYSESVVYEIERYEKKFDIQIFKIYFCCDQNIDSGCMMIGEDYPYVFAHAVKRYTQRDFVVKCMADEEKTELFGDRDWKVFVPEEQLVFKEDTLYLCCY